MSTKPRLIQIPRSRPVSAFDKAFFKNVRFRVSVPEMMEKWSTSKLLTMEFIDGVSVTDVEMLKKQKVHLGKLARLVAETFNEMIFFFGKVHCDPHAANLVVRRRNGRDELVLLDHGLYQELSPELRQAYASLWESLIFGDREGIQKYSEKMNAGDLYPIFASMLTYKEWTDITDKSLTHLDVKCVRKEWFWRLSRFVRRKKRLKSDNGMRVITHNRFRRFCFAFREKLFCCSKPMIAFERLTERLDK